MCGIVAVSGVEKAAEQAYLSLYALQHRGQEAAGIVAHDGVTMRSHKGRGLVSDVFDAAALAKLRGDTATSAIRRPVETTWPTPSRSPPASHGAS
jgi:amidophosphoribosyltransferase